MIFGLQVPPLLLSHRFARSTARLRMEGVLRRLDCWRNYIKISSAVRFGETKCY